MLYNGEMIGTFLDSYISLLYLLTNVAQIKQIPKGIVQAMATSENISTLFELYEVVDCNFRIKILLLIRNLFKCGVSKDMFDQACRTIQNSEEEQQGVLISLFDQ